MKTALLSDVHGNLEAFTAVCDSLRRESVDRIIFLGDVVGYGADPNACVDLLQTLTGQIVAGNHDWVAAGRYTADNFNPTAKAAIEWTREHLDSRYKLFLMALPLTLCIDGMLCVHATPDTPSRWNYVFNAGDASAVFETFSNSLCFIAHSHYPTIFSKLENGDVTQAFVTHLPLHATRRYIINCGSVGQPRDGNPCASYGIFDSTSNEFRLMRVAYDVATAQKKIVHAGLPDFLAYRISAGR